MIEPKIGEIFSLHGMMVKTCSMKDNEHCVDCAFAYLDCDDVNCSPNYREDSAQVIFKKVQEMEVKIQIPDNCELIKDGDTYIVKEKKQGLPRSWEEFCKRYPIKSREAFIDSSSHIQIRVIDSDRYENTGRNWCYSKEEAEAFLALMQLRQLRKAWIGDWEPSRDVEHSVILVEKMTNRLEVGYGYWSYNYSMTFPTEEMAYDFLNCFRDLCETAKILL